MKYKKVHCKDCGKLLSKFAYYYNYKRCNSCSKKYLLKNYKNNPAYKHGKTLKSNLCIDCKIKIYYMSKRCASCAMKFLFKNKKNHPNWRGGISFNPYDKNFNEIYKEQIRKRDNYKCQLCGVPQIECIRKLNIHHVDYDKKNTNQKNNISLCNSCNIKVNKSRKYWSKYFRNLIKRQYGTNSNMLCGVNKK